MKPHLYKFHGKWACKLRMLIIQRDKPLPITIYIAEGSTPREAYDRCQQCRFDRLYREAKC